MKLFKTSNGLTGYTQSVFLIPNGDTTIAQQFTDTGVFQNVIDIKIKEEFAVDKQGLIKALNVFKNPTAKETNVSLFLSENGKKTKLQKVAELSRPQVRFDLLKKEQFQPVPEGFFTNLKLATSFTNQSHQKIALRGVTAIKNNFFATDEFKLTRIKTDLDMETIMIPVGSISDIQKLTHFFQEDGLIWFADEDLSEIAKIKLYDGIPPRFETVFDGISNGAKEVEYHFDMLKEALSNASTLGGKKITLSNNKVVSDTGYEQEIELALDDLTVTYSIEKLKEALLNGTIRLQNVPTNPAIIFEKDNQTNIVLAYRTE